MSKAKLITQVHRISYDEIIDSLDIGSVIYPKYLTVPGSGHRHTQFLKKYQRLLRRARNRYLIFGTDDKITARNIDIIVTFQQRAV